MSGQRKTLKTGPCRPRVRSVNLQQIEGQSIARLTGFENEVLTGIRTSGGSPLERLIAKEEFSPRFVNFVVCHMTDKQKGIGRLDVGLFGKPFIGDGNAEIWNEALQELAAHCQKKDDASILPDSASPPWSRGVWFVRE
jgi:hypothetical protein